MKTSDQEAKLIEDGMATFYAIRDERDKLSAMCVNWERAHQIIQSENEMLKARVVTLEAEKGFYQRFSSELVANVADIGRLCEGVLLKSKQGAYRPNGAMPRQHDEPAPGDEVPKFLTVHDGRQSSGVEGDLAGMLDTIVRHARR